MEKIKVKNMVIEPVNIELDSPFKISIGTKFSIENVIITVILENGIEGYGEAAPLEPINGENQATVIATLKSCRDFIIGKYISDYRSISEAIKNVFRVQVTARCAVEMALIDAFTKTLDIPFYNFLGGATDKIETDYTIDIVSAEEAKRDAQTLAREGYKILKTKVGKNLANDIDRLLAIKEGAPGCELTLDANQGYSPAGAVHFLEELGKRNIRPLLFEQPVIRTDLTGMKYVRDHTSVPIAADESVFTSADALNIVRASCADIINIKIMKSGIIEALDIIAIARTANIKLMIGCMLETKLALGYSVHIAAGTGCFDFIDLDPHSNPGKEPFAGGPEFVPPLYSCSGEAGIGIRKK